MADKKISQLTTLAQADVAVTADFLPIVDTSATETKKATPQALVQAGATGATLPAALGAVATPSYTFTGDLNTGMWSPAADTLALSTNGVERLRVNDSGVGIGAASGTSSGYATAPQFLNYNASATNLLNASDTSSIIRCATYRDTTGGGVISIAKFRGTYASPAAVQSGDTSGRLFFDVWGGSNLRRIAEVGALVDTYTSDSNISGALYFATSTSGNASSNEKMRLTAAGDLGIGTTSPFNRLAVVGSDPVLYLVNSKAAADNNVARLTLNPSSAFNNSGYYNLGPSIDGLLESASTNACALVFSTYNGSSLVERMRLDSSGNLGIGTASPVTKLNVASAAGSPTSVSVGGIRVYETTNNYGLNIGGDGTYGYIQGVRGSTSSIGYNDLVLQPNSGNLGIGTASPTALLDVNADTMRLRTARTPASAGAAGNAGDICWDSSYLYICTATNTWRRIAHATW